MNGGVLSGGVIFVIAALLWAAVLVPAWMRRREFKAAEQNAVRLQRTLRVLAETAEVPTEVRVEATAREALAQEKILRTAQRRQESERQAQLAEARADQVRAQIKAQHAARIHATLERTARLNRPWVRRLRGVAAVIAAGAAATVLVGAGLLFAGQGTTVLVVSALVFLVASAALVLVAPGRVKLVAIPAELTSNQTPVRHDETLAAPAVAPALDATSAAHAANQAAAAARIVRARALARARAEGVGSADFSAQPGSMLSASPAKFSAAATAAAATAAVQPSSPTGSDMVESDSLATAQAAKVPTITARVAPVDPAIAHQIRAENAIDRSLQAAAVVSADRAVVRSTAERLRTMGLVGDTSDGKLELDAALRRIREAG